MRVFLRTGACLSVALASCLAQSAGPNAFDTAAGRGPDLTAGVYRHGGSESELYKTIRNGIPGTEMPTVRATDDEVWKMVGFVKAIGASGLTETAPGDAIAGKAIYNGKGGCTSC